MKNFKINNVSLGLAVALRIFCSASFDYFCPISYRFDVFFLKYKFYVSKVACRLEVCEKSPGRRFYPVGGCVINSFF